MCPKHNSRCEELGKSVADGKELLATTISEYVDTASDATWDVISENIKSAIEENKFKLIACENKISYFHYGSGTSEIIFDTSYPYKNTIFLGTYRLNGDDFVCIFENEIGYHIETLADFLIVPYIFFDNRLLSSEYVFQTKALDGLKRNIDYQPPTIYISIESDNDGARFIRIHMGSPKYLQINLWSGYTGSDRHYESYYTRQEYLQCDIYYIGDGEPIQSGQP